MLKLKTALQLEKSQSKLLCIHMFFDFFQMGEEECFLDHLKLLKMHHSESRYQDPNVFGSS
jgi:hypothetical protein